MNLWIEGSAETDEQRRNLVALAVGVAQSHGYSCRIAADQVELSGNGISGWVLDLENLHRKVADEPRDQWPALVVDHMSTVLSGINLAAETPLNKDNFELIRRLIRTRMYPESAQDTHVPIVSRTLAPGLVQRVVLDQVNTIVPVNHDDLARWPIHERELFKLAEANTHDDGLLEVSDIGGASAEKIVGLYGSPDYASAHIRWLGAYPITGRWGSAFIVPCEGSVYVHPLTGKNVLGALGTMAKIATRMHAERPSPVSSSVYWWHDGIIDLAAFTKQSLDRLGLYVLPEFQKVMEDIAGQDYGAP